MFVSVLRMSYNLKTFPHLHLVMNKAATVHARIESDLKHQAEDILRKVGLSSAEAIRLFYKQVCMHQGLPFEIKLPNDETRKAIEELESGKGQIYKCMDDVWDDIKDA